MNDFSCPHCGSNQTQRASAVYGSGTAHGSASGYADSVRGGVTSVQSRSAMSTPTAARLAPPRNPNTFSGQLVQGGVTLGIIAVFAGMLLPPLGGAILLLGACLLAVGLVIYPVEKPLRWRRYRRLLAQWQSLWYCHRCDSAFMATDDLSNYN